ncbi:MAG: Mor protein [Ignavibacteria bacterium]|nr:Mor protein [Ignavibacteria bacterium]
MEESFKNIGKIMRNEDIIEMLEEQDLPEHFQIVAEVCGIETARLLIKELGGITVSIPMVNSLRSLIERYIADNAKEIPIKKIARELGMNERAVARIIKSLRGV